MGNVTLDDCDRVVLERLRAGSADVDALAGSVNLDAGYLRDRLPELADNGLIRRASGDDYALTDDGSRVLESTAARARDERVDTPPAVEGRILAFDLPPGRTAAVRNAFTFLRYWGEASAGEIVDAGYSEAPAGFADWRAWWTECVRDRLAELPSIEPPSSTVESWRYDGIPIVENGSSDGRDVAGDGATQGTSAKFAIERLDLDEESRRAVRRGFDLLVELELISATEAKEQVYLEHDAGYGSPDAWWDDCVRPGLESLPGVERVDEMRERWRYRPVDDA
jgi:predicted transcriptional regulator